MGNSVPEIIGDSLTNFKYHRAIALAAILLLTSCHSAISNPTPESTVMINNPVSYFEIPVTDMVRAIDFYESVFSVSLDSTVIHGNDMALFPYDEGSQGVSGALAKGDSYKPSKAGPRIYFFVESIDETLRRAVAKGGRVVFSKTPAGTFWVAEFEDSEGNLIALSSDKE